jgi:hypothetical protein
MVVMCEPNHGINVVAFVPMVLCTYRMYIIGLFYGIHAHVVFHFVLYITVHSLDDTDEHWSAIAAYDCTLAGVRSGHEEEGSL